MNNKVKQMISLFLAFAMIVTFVTPHNVYAKTKKQQYVTRVDVLQQVEKIIGARATSNAIAKVKDVKKGASSYKIMSIALNAGLAKPDSKQKMYPDKPATNKYVASILAKITESTTAEMLGNKKANGKLTKSDLKKYLNKQFPNIVYKSNSKVKKGNVVINKPVVLNNTEISGNLIIGDGVADKEVTLNNVTVKGKTIVRGGGENSIIITGTSNISDMIIRQVNNKVSIKVKDDAKVSMVYINDGSNDVNIVGQVGSLNVVGKNLTVTLTEATIASLVVSNTAKNAVIVAGENSIVKEATLNAAGAIIKGDGKVENVNVNANDTVVTVKDAKINTKENITPPKTNEDGSDNKPSADSSGGGTSTGGNTSGGTSGGETDDPDVPDEPVVKYETDSRYADGYPKIELDKQTASYTVKYKLKDGIASKETPAKIYSAISEYNTGWDATTQAIIHGHFGIVTDKKHEAISANKYDFVKITDSEEYSQTYQISGGHNEGIVFYSVIDCNGEISETPTRIAIDKDSASSVVVNSVYISDISLNQARNQIYLYTEDELDTTHLPAPDAFSVKDLDGKEIAEGVKVEIESTNNMRGYSCVKILLEAPITDNKYNSYYLSYNGTEIQDTMGNKMDKFSNRGVWISSITPSKGYVSDDGHYLQISFPISIYKTYDSDIDAYNDMDLYVDGIKINREKWRYAYTFTNTIINLYDVMLTDIKDVELRSANGKKFYNDTEDELTVLKTKNLYKEKTVSSLSTTAVYNKTEGTLTLKMDNVSDLSGGIGFFACNFIIKVDGKEYRARGESYIDTWSGGNNEFCKIELSDANLKHIDLSSTENIFIKYAPIGEVSVNSIGKYISYQSGKPVEKFDYIPVTIQ